MERIGVRELNQNTSQVLARVSHGETVEITDRGRPIARLVPVGDDRSTLARLVASGRATPPGSVGPSGGGGSRSVAPVSPQALVGVPAAVGRLFRVEIDSTVRATAAAFAEPTLRSLDAIHLATAQVLTNASGTELIAFVTYDRRLLECAKTAGLPATSPGQD